MASELKILLIEDNKVDARNFARVLSNTGIIYSFKHSSSSMNGLEEVKKNNYDLVFLDNHLPSTNGLELLKLIRNLGIQIPIVIITSYADANTAIEFIKSGASDYIPKSILNVEGLSHCISNCVRVSELERRKRETEIRLKKVEDRLGTIISNTPIILFVLDGKGFFRLGIGKDWITFNPLSSSVIGLCFKEVFIEYKSLNSAFESALQGNIEKCTVEINEIIFEVTFTPSLLDDGVVNEIQGLALDVTDHIKGKESLSEAKKIAENAADLKQSFVAKMSHEIRTPMNSIIGFTNLLKETSLTKIQKEFVQAINVSGENLHDLVNNILSFSKIEAGKISINKKDFVLDDILQDVFIVLEGKAKDKKIKLDYSINPQVPAIIKGDKTRLYQVLLNLVGNAIKFTHVGYVLVNAAVKRTVEDIIYINFEIIDTGVGIPKNKQELIFDNFMQTDVGEEAHYGGSGLGLTIVQDLLKLMGGSISVKSEEGKGSSFIFNLPFGLADEEVVIKTEQKNTTINYDKLKGKRILLAEDNMMNQKLVIMYLKQFEVLIDLAETGFQAVKAVKSNDYDLILMDVQMPDMDGIEATHEIRNMQDTRKKTVPIIAMTAHAFKKEIEKCLEAGMSSHVSKPINKEEFVQMIYELIFSSRVITTPKSKYIKRDKPLVDLSYLRDMSEGNNGFVQQMINIFKNDSPVLISEMRKAFDYKQWDKLSKVAHKYRSPTVIMGMKSVSQLAEIIEYNDFSKGNFNEIELLISQIETQSSEAINYIQSNFGHLQ